MRPKKLFGVEIFDSGNAGSGKSEKNPGMKNFWEKMTKGSDDLSKKVANLRNSATPTSTGPKKEKKPNPEEPAESKNLVPILKISGLTDLSPNTPVKIKTRTSEKPGKTKKKVNLRFQRMRS